MTDADHSPTTMQAILSHISRYFVYLGLLQLEGSNNILQETGHLITMVFNLFSLHTLKHFWLSLVELCTVILGQVTIGLLFLVAFLNSLDVVHPLL